MGSFEGTAMAPRSSNRALPLTILAFAATVACWSWSSCPRLADPSQVFVSGMPTMRRSVRATAVAMRSEKTDKIVESLKELTLLEASELVKAIEETFGVDASASAGAVMMAAPAGGGEEEDKPAEKTEFDVVLTDVPKAKKIAILKVVRGILGVGLKEAKG